ncbi:MAG: 2-oxoglutarate dehydrogenase complex dihydrolipoyllysine-residue succinyltransferase [Chloroflexi bacterium]|nr:MAG: 2-oxoglutarate dehydrogenase complex dihydrolipoyllysine-residue succinyltransferase [Chloroflexota bacterium]
MSVEIRIPTLGESIVDATIASWLKKEGEPVHQGETLVELETDKVNVEVSAEQDGILQKVLKHEGDIVAVGEVIGMIGVGVQASNGATVVAPKASETPVVESQRAPSPLARRIAAEHNVDISQVRGTHPHGRVTKDDVISYLSQASQQVAAPTQATAAQTSAPVAKPAIQAAPVAAARPTVVASERPEERVRMSRRRQTIAQRLVEAQHTAAMLTTFNEIDMTAVIDVRSRRKETFKERHNVSLGFMSFFTKAVMGALKAYPRLNAEIQGNEMIIKRYYDIGIAVGAEEGLVVPVVRDADRKSFAEIEREIADLAKRARENALTLTELQGGTFTITNGGIFGSLLSTPILNGPQVGILGMHKIEQRPLALNGQVVIRPMMYVALSYDHRIVDGSEAVRFLVKVKELIEDPEALLLEG